MSERMKDRVEQDRVQPEPVKIDRRKFLTGAFLAGAGIAELVVSGLSQRMNLRQRAEQHTRAYNEIKERGTPAEPDQQAVARAQQLRNELQNSDPLRPSTPQLEEAKAQAAQTLHGNEVFAKAWQQRESELRSIEGPSEVTEKTDEGVAYIGLATTLIGTLNLAKAKSDYDDARYEQEKRKQYPGLYPELKNPTAK